MSNETTLPAVTNEEYAQRRAENIAKSKVFGDGITSPMGVLDVLFYDTVSGQTTRYTGQTTPGRVMFLMPFRTKRNLDKWAVYTIPSSWKAKLGKGSIVNAEIADGYIKKLHLSTNFMKAAEVVNLSITDTQAFEEDAQYAVDEVEAENAPNVTAEQAPTVQDAVPEGFDAETSDPF